jgi:hypothetical protein
MKKLFAQCLTVFLWPLLMSVPAQADTLEKAENWILRAQEASGVEGCAYSEWLSDLTDDPDRPQRSYGDWVHSWNGHEIVSPSSQLPLQFLKLLDASLKACSLPAGKGIPNFYVSKNKWMECFSYQYCNYDQADALALAGSSVKDGVTRYWQRNGKTHIRFSLNGTAKDLYLWAKRQGIALQLARQQTNGPVYNRDPLILRGKTVIPVFVVSPEGLTPARIVDFAAGGDSCQGGNWVEAILENDTTPPVRAVIALRDPGLAKKAKVTRQRQLETQEKDTHYLELRRDVLKLEFENDVLPSLLLVARQLGFWETNHEISKENSWMETGRTLRGSVWGTEIFIPDAAYAKQNAWNPSAVFGRPISFLGSPRCPPPAPE